MLQNNQILICIVKSYNYSIVMSRIQGKWKNQVETNWIILDKLIREGPMNLPSLENKNGRNSLSHASVRKGINRLEKRFLVIQTEVDESLVLLLREDQAILR